MELKLEDLKGEYFFDFNFTKEQFQTAILNTATKMMMRKGVLDNFKPNTDQQKFIDQMFLYFTGDENYKGGLAKGQALIGPIGTGKTILLKSIYFVLKDNERFRRQGGATWVSAKEINRKSGEKHYATGVDFSSYEVDMVTKYSKGFLFIDDLGKESLEVVVFGNHMKPVTDIISEKYDLGTKLFFTSNMTMEEIEKHYGSSIADRLKEIVNFNILKGKSLRR